MHVRRAHPDSPLTSTAHPLRHLHLEVRHRLSEYGNDVPPLPAFGRRLFYCQFFFFQAEDGIRDYKVTGVQTCALPIPRQRPLSAEDSPPPFRHGREQLHDGGRRRMPSVRILYRRRELLAQFLAELHAPLVEGVDAPHDALREHAVLIERDEPA